MNKPKIIQIIDVVSNAIAGNRIDEDFIKSCIYGKVDAELYAHLLGKYRGYDGDFFQFYLGTDDRINRALLENLGIKVEPDKYPDYDSRIVAQVVQENGINEYGNALNWSLFWIKANPEDKALLVDHVLNIPER